MLPSEQQLITENQIITPLINVLDEITPKPVNTKIDSKQNISFKQSLDDLFPEQQYEERNIQRAKDILGDLSDKFTSEELKVAVTEIQFLAQSWLDDFEREIFGGLTLQELLHEKGGL